MNIFKTKKLIHLLLPLALLALFANCCHATENKTPTPAFELGEGAPNATFSKKATNLATNIALGYCAYKFLQYTLGVLYNFAKEKYIIHIKYGNWTKGDVLAYVIAPASVLFSSTYVYKTW